MSRNKMRSMLEENSPARQALPQILAVSVKNILLLAFGMTLGFPTILVPSLSGSNPSEKIRLNQEEISWVGSLNLICVPLGCILSGSLTYAIGRRRAMQLTSIPLLTAWTLFHYSDATWQVFLALCLTGFSGGLMEAPTLTYVAEITQPHLRGILSSTSTLSVSFGVLTQFLLGSFMNWRTVALVNCSMPVLSFICLMFVPETPVWLITKNKLNEARKSIAWLRGWTTVQAIEREYQELLEQIRGSDEKANNNQEMPSTELTRLEVLKELTKKSFLWPFSVVCFTFFLSHFNGSAPLAVFAIKIFSTLKTPIDNYYATVIMGTVQLLGTALCVIFIHVVGKRVINFISISGVAICLFIVATYSYAIDIQYLEGMSPKNETPSLVESNNTHISDETHHWAPVCFLVLAAFLNFLGIRILPWILIGEVFPNKIRATAAGISGAVGYVFGFIANKIFLRLVETITLPGVFWLYSGIGLIGLVTIYFVLPETEGKSLYEITEHFDGKINIGNKVKRTKNGQTGVSNAGFVLDDKEKKAESQF